MIQPSSRKSTNCGISVTMYGNIMPLNISMNRKSRPGNRMRANPYADNDADRMPPTSVNVVTIIVFARNVSAGTVESAVA